MKRPMLGAVRPGPRRSLVVCGLGGLYWLALMGAGLVGYAGGVDDHPLLTHSWAASSSAAAGLGGDAAGQPGTAAAPSSSPSPLEGAPAGSDWVAVVVSRAASAAPSPSPSGATQPAPAVTQPAAVAAAPVAAAAAPPTPAPPSPVVQQAPAPANASSGQTGGRSGDSEAPERPTSRVPVVIAPRGGGLPSLFDGKGEVELAQARSDRRPAKKDSKASDRH